MKKMFFSVALVAIVCGSALAFEPTNPSCVAPAAAGGGWDFTCRQVSRVFRKTKILNTSMKVTNLEGGGGGVAFSEIVNKRGDDSNVIVAASTATITRLAQGAYPGNTPAQVRWIGTIGADYGVIGVAADSDIRNLSDLMLRLKKNPRSIAFAGGSATGGWDHLKVLMIAKAFGIDGVQKMKYVAFSGGGEAMTQILAGSVQAFTGDLSEARGFVASGDMRIIAVLSPQRLSGFAASYPTAKEQGIDVVGANWRGFYAPGGISDAAYDFWVAKLKKMYDSPEWKSVMRRNGLSPLDLSGDDFRTFVFANVARIKDVMAGFVR